MSDLKKEQLDSETILLTLDQIGQTIDIMTSVVGRLRGYITEQLDGECRDESESKELQPFPESISQTVH